MALDGIITLDMETHYSREYSLSKLTTEEYIRDNRFEVIGVGLAFNNDDPVWISGTHKQIKNRLKKLPWERLGLLAHNTMFDAAILNWHFDIRPKALFDTLSMARPIIGAGESVSLANLARQFGVGEKGDEVINALGKRRADFSPVEMERYAGYCKQDVALTKRLFDVFMKLGFPMKELRLIDLTLRMFTEPVLRLDAASISEHLTNLRKTKKELLMDTMVSLERKDLASRVAVGDEEAVTAVQKLLRSDANFAQLLRKLGVEPPTKISPRTGKEAYAFAKSDAAFKELEDHPDPRVQTLVSARVGVKTTMEESRAERFLDMSRRGLFPVPLRYCGAHTTRWSGQDKINLQNLSSRGKYGGKLKSAILPPEGHVFISCDSSQIEARVLAWWARQDDLVQAFREERDVYSEMASEIYRRKIDRKRKEIDEEGREIYPDFVEGFVGKTTILSCGYGAGGGSFKEMLRVMGGVKVPIEEANRVVQVYRARYPAIPKLWREANQAIENMASGYVTELGRNGVVKVTPDGLVLPNGLTIHYKGLHAEVNPETGYKEWVYYQGKRPTRIYGGKLVENACQAMARIIIGEQMLRIARRYKPVLTVHDAIGVVAPIEHRREAVAYVEECMSWTPKWAEGLPLACESGAGLSYGSAES